MSRVGLEPDDSIQELIADAFLVLGKKHKFMPRWSEIYGYQVLALISASIGGITFAYAFDKTHPVPYHAGFIIFTAVLLLFDLFLLATTTRFVDLVRYPLAVRKAYRLRGINRIAALRQLHVVFYILRWVTDDPDVIRIADYLAVAKHEIRRASSYEEAVFLIKNSVDLSIHRALREAIDAANRTRETIRPRP